MINRVLILENEYTKIRELYVHFTSYQQQWPYGTRSQFRLMRRPGEARNQAYDPWDMRRVALPLNQGGF